MMHETVTFSAFEWTMIGFAFLILFSVVAVIMLYGEHREREQFKEIMRVAEDRHLINLTISNIMMLKLLHKKMGTKETLKIITGVYDPIRLREKKNE